MLSVSWRESFQTFINSFWPLRSPPFESLRMSHKPKYFPIHKPNSGTWYSKRKPRCQKKTPPFFVGLPSHATQSRIQNKKLVINMYMKSFTSINLERSCSCVHITWQLDLDLIPEIRLGSWQLHPPNHQASRRYHQLFRHRPPLGPRREGIWSNPSWISQSHNAYIWYTSLFNTLHYYSLFPPTSRSTLMATLPLLLPLKTAAFAKVIPSVHFFSTSLLIPSFALFSKIEHSLALTFNKKLLLTFHMIQTWMI